MVSADAGVEQIAQKIETLRETHGVAAASVVLVDRNALLLHRTTGVADRATGQRASADTRFRVGSVTKAFTGLALLRAQSRGLLKLDQPVAELLPTQKLFDNPWEATHPLRVAHLMEHTAGWFDMSAAEFDGSDPSPLKLERALALNPPSRRSHWPPGTHHEYSNSGAGLAARVLEVAAKRPFEDIMASEVFAPLGMRSASLIADPETLRHLARGYDRDGRTPIPYWHILYRAAGGLNLDPRDMAPFLRMLINRGKVGDAQFLSPADIARFEHPHTTEAARHGLAFGYGLGVRQYLHDGRSLFGHGGDADGYLAHFAYSVDSGRGYFVVINAFNAAPIDAMQDVLDTWLIADLPSLPPPPAAKLSQATLSALSGSYLAATTRFPEPEWERRTLSVIARGSRLFTRSSDDGEQELIAVDATRFRRSWETTATSIFIKSSNGSLLLQGPMGNWRRPP